MTFDPGIKLGDKLSNDEMRNLFQCGNMGGMRPSRKTGTLVIISDDTKGLYRDVWKNGVLHYTGTGKVGDQVLTGRKGHPNGTLYHSDTNGVEVHLFEVMEKAVYTYRGVVKLADKPYLAKQPDENGRMRNVWVFPVKPVEMFKTEMANPQQKEVRELSERELIRRSEMIREKKAPQKTETVVYYRDPYLRELVKRIAEGKCQFCGKQAPFVDNNGIPYLEEHHVKKLADGGPDTINNIVAICPNCHRKMHVLNKEEDRIVLESVAMHNEELLQRMSIYNVKVKNSKRIKHED